MKSDLLGWIDNSMQPIDGERNGRWDKARRAHGAGEKGGG